jgi:putative transcriptional regulator
MFKTLDRARDLPPGAGPALPQVEAHLAAHEAQLHHQAPPDVDVRAIRHRLELSQNEFAARFGFSLAAVREWEQGRRRPEQAARTLLLVINRNPEIVSTVLEEAIEAIGSA